MSSKSSILLNESLSSLNIFDSLQTEDSIRNRAIATGLQEHAQDQGDAGRKQYSPLRTTFWEEVRYNPYLITKDQEYAYKALDLEQQVHWKRKGHVWDKVPRFSPEKPPPLRGPTKPDVVPNCFEKPEKYFGRKRVIAPFVRAQLYSKPIERSVPTRKSVEKKEIPSPIDPPDYWRPREEGGAIKRSHFMESTSIRDVYQGLGVKTPHNAPKTRAKEITRAKIRSIFSVQPNSTQDASNVRIGSARDMHHHEELPLSPTKHSGVSFPRAANRPLSGIGDRAQFLRMRDEDTGHIVIVKVEDFQRDGLNSIPKGYSIVETWARPHSVAEGVDIGFDAIPSPTSQRSVSEEKISLKEQREASKSAGALQFRKMQDAAEQRPKTSYHSTAPSGFTPPKVTRSIPLALSDRVGIDVKRPPAALQTMLRASSTQSMEPVKSSLLPRERVKSAGTAKSLMEKSMNVLNAIEWDD